MLSEASSVVRCTGGWGGPPKCLPIARFAGLSGGGPGGGVPRTGGGCASAKCFSSALRRGTRSLRSRSGSRRAVSRRVPYRAERLRWSETRADHLYAHRCSSHVLFTYAPLGLESSRRYSDGTPLVAIRCAATVQQPRRTTTNVRKAFGEKLLVCRYFCTLTNICDIMDPPLHGGGRGFESPRLYLRKILLCR